jgi:hypothetical protein
LRSLRDDAFPVIQEYLQRNPGGSGAASELQTKNNALALETFAILSRAVQHGALPELQGVHQAVRNWADALGIRNAWILDAAIQSMRAWGLGAKIGKWAYTPDELKTPTFQPSFGIWIPYFSNCTLRRFPLGTLNGDNVLEWHWFRGTNRDGRDGVSSSLPENVSMEHLRLPARAENPSTGWHSGWSGGRPLRYAV